MVSNTQDTAFCLYALEQAFGYWCPEIFNSKQGCQFTSTALTDIDSNQGRADLHGWAWASL
ncbi:MAG: hypothetical protein NPIRA02_38800 [Nitrospirales bacterium]|nr:MAG: hypothetical protein NPIRA02_38800 [Nitrospirales bacterium]